MAALRISDIAERAKIHASAIRYYEQIGLLPHAERQSGQRRYDESALHRLALIHRARLLGFTLAETRELFFGFGTATAASARWQSLSRRKLAELDLQMRSIRTMRKLLNEMMTKCRCETFEQCGRGIYRSGNVTGLTKTCDADLRSRSRK